MAAAAGPPHDLNCLTIGELEQLASGRMTKYAYSVSLSCVVSNTAVVNPNLQLLGRQKTIIMRVL